MADYSLEGSVDNGKDNNALWIPCRVESSAEIFEIGRPISDKEKGKSYWHIIVKNGPFSEEKRYALMQFLEWKMTKNYGKSF